MHRKKWDGVAGRAGGRVWTGSGTPGCGGGWRIFPMAAAIWLLAAAPWGQRDAFAGASGGSADATGVRPPEILSWRHQILPKEQYADLATRWEAYVAAHPKDPRAWVEWGHALRYSGNFDLALKKYAQAFAIDSTDVVAVNANQFNISAAKAGEIGLSHQRFLRAIARDPDYPGIYYNLWTTALHGGDQALADRCLRRMVELGDMPPPLLDFGSNMVNGAPHGAIILTNGDNDTYPPLAYQVLSGKRGDVAIVNLGMLNLPWYVRYWRERGLPITISDSRIDRLKEDEPKKLLGTIVVENLFENVQKPGSERSLFYSVTVAQERKALPAKLVREGLLERIVPDPTATDCCAKDVDLRRTRELCETVYRLDSATDPLVNWERENAVAMLMRNYAFLLSHLGEGLIESGSVDAAEPYLYQAAEIVAFHRDEEFLKGLLELWREKIPKGRLLPAAEALAASK